MVLVSLISNFFTIPWEGNWLWLSCSNSALLINLFSFIFGRKGISKLTDLQYCVHCSMTRKIPLEIVIWALLTYIHKKAKTRLNCFLQFALWSIHTNCEYFFDIFWTRLDKYQETVSDLTYQKTGMYQKWFQNRGYE